MRRIINVDLPTLSDEELTLNAEELFLSLEQSEDDYLIAIPHAKLIRKLGQLKIRTVIR